jgi:hypothetical protein
MQLLLHHVSVLEFIELCLLGKNHLAFTLHDLPRGIEATGEAYVPHAGHMVLERCQTANSWNFSTYACVLMLCRKATGSMRLTWMSSSNYYHQNPPTYSGQSFEQVPTL